MKANDIQVGEDYALLLCHSDCTPSRGTVLAVGPHRHAAAGTGIHRPRTIVVAELAGLGRTVRLPTLRVLRPWSEQEQLNAEAADGDKRQASRLNHLQHEMERRGMSPIAAVRGDRVSVTLDDLEVLCGLDQTAVSW